MALEATVHLWGTIEAVVPSGSVVEMAFLYVTTNIAFTGGSAASFTPTISCHKLEVDQRRARGRSAKNGAASAGQPTALPNETWKKLMNGRLSTAHTVKFTV
jgi:hypothetical protein